MTIIRKDMKHTIHFRKYIIGKSTVEFEGSIRQLAKDIGEDFTYLSKILRGYACSEEKAKQIIDKAQTLTNFKK